MRTYLAATAAALGALVLVGCQSNDKTQWSQESRRISLDTQPPGAHVWQISAPSGSRVDLGMTPIVDQQVSVMTKYHGSFSDMGSAQNMMSSLNQVRLHIEKAGFQPYDLLMSPSPSLVEHRSIVLEPATQPATQPAPTTAASAGR